MLNKKETTNIIFMFAICGEQEASFRKLGECSSNVAIATVSEFNIVLDITKL